jgi:hypothetical protein
MRWKRTPKHWDDFKAALTDSLPLLNSQIIEHTGSGKQRFLFLGIQVPEFTKTKKNYNQAMMLDIHYLFEFLWVDQGEKVCLNVRDFERLKVLCEAE